MVFCHHRSHARIHHRLGVLTVAWSALVSPLPLSTCWVLVSHHRSQAWKHHGFVGSTFRACVHASTELSAPAQQCCCTSRWCCCHTYMLNRDAGYGLARESFPHFKIVLTFLAGFLDIISESWVVSSLFYVTVTGRRRMKTTVKDENIICWCCFRINVCNCL